MSARRSTMMTLAKLKLAPGWRQRVEQKTVDEIAESLARDGQITPIIVLRNGLVVDGEHRVAAAQKAKLRFIECVVDSPSKDVRTHEAKVITSRTKRVHLAGPARDAALARLAEIYGAGVSAQAEQKLPGRPQTPGLERVATETGTSRRAVQIAVERHRHRQAEPDPELAPAAETEQDRVRSVVLPALKKIDGHMRQVQAEINRLLQGEDEIGEHFRLGYHARLQGWLRVAHDLAYDVRANAPDTDCPYCGGGGGACKTCSGLGLVPEKTPRPA